MLVVDDDAAVQAILRRLLESHGFLVVTTATLSEAVAAATTQRVNAVVLDLTLSGNDSGLDVLGWLRAEPYYRDVLVLILTGATSLPEHEEEFIRRHRAFVFYKPQSYGVVIEYLNRLLHRPG